MQTIRIYRLPIKGQPQGIIASITGIPGHVETAQLRAQYPEDQYMWMR